MLMERLKALMGSRVGLFAKKLMDDQAPNLAALLAWGTLSALLPLLLGVLSLIGLVLRDPERLDKMYGTLLTLLPPEMATMLGGVLGAMRQSPAGLAGIVALLLLLVNGSNFFSNMASVFDQAYHVQPRNFLMERLIALAMLIVTAALLGVFTLATGLDTLIDALPGSLPIGPVLGKLVGWSLSIVSAFLMFLLVYRVLPNTRQIMRETIPGALLSTVLALVISQVFPLYVTLFPPNQAYAVFGVFLVFTFWLYLVGFVFVLGAELNAFLQQPTRSVALAEATASAEQGRAEYELGPGHVRARSTGQAPAVSSLSVSGEGSAQDQIEAQQGEARHEPVPRDRGVSPREHGIAGHVLGFIGLIVAVVMLRGQTAKPKGERGVA